MTTVDQHAEEAIALLRPAPLPTGPLCVCGQVITWPAARHRCDPHAADCQDPDCHRCEIADDKAGERRADR